MQHALPWQPIGDLWWYGTVDADNQCLYKSQLQLPGHGHICWFVEWAWLLHVSACTVVLMAALIMF